MRLSFYTAYVFAESYVLTISELTQYSVQCRACIGYRAPRSKRVWAHHSEMIKNRLWLFHAAAASGKMSEFEIINRYYHTSRTRAVLDIFRNMGYLLLTEALQHGFIGRESHPNTHITYTTRIRLQSIAGCSGSVLLPVSRWTLPGPGVSLRRPQTTGETQGNNLLRDTRPFYLLHIRGKKQDCV